MNEETVAIVDLADDLGLRKQTVFKVATRLGIELGSRREPSRRNQIVSTVTASEAAAITHELSESNGPRASPIDGGAPVRFVGDDDGYFYVVQLEPEYDPGRIKVGYSTDVDGRLRKHRCSAPFAICRKYWPCRRSWERTAIDCVTDGLEQLHTEVFRTPNIEAVLERSDQFFQLMPKVGEYDDETDVESDDVL